MNDIKKIRKMAEECLEEGTEFDTPNLVKFVIDLCHEVEENRRRLKAVAEQANFGIKLCDLLRKTLEE